MRTPKYIYISTVVAVTAFTTFAGEADLRPLKAKSEPAPFSYIESPDVMPNYLAGEKWSTQGQSITRMQAPLSPEESSKRLVIQPGFSSQLWAAEPDITKPIALAWDERGRLWIAETIDYPNDMQPDGEGNDRIKICEDTDGDGTADRFTVFADKLSVPTSLCFGNGGLIVIEGGRTLFLKDTDGDDVADERRVLFDNWGTRDTHAAASNLRYGPDNWIWGTVGYSGFDGEVGGKRLRFGQGVYRFKPDGSELEFIKSSNNNTWGLGITEDGLIVGSTANGNASWYMPIPNRFYEAVNGWSANRMESVADDQGIYPITDKVRQVDWHDQYTAGAGHALYTARSFPEEYWNKVSFVTEPTGHLVGFFKLGDVGADRTAVNMGSFLASDDEWAAPIVAEVGPDGALWVIDWYNYIIQHNPTPIGFQNGKGNAYETELRDKRHGRIYRVTYDGGTPSKSHKLSLSDPAGLIAALRSDNQLWRMHAQRMIVEGGQGDRDFQRRLVELISDREVDSLGLNVGVQHALWTLKGLGAIESSSDVRIAVQRNLYHDSGAVRLAAVTVLPRDEATIAAFVSANILADPNAQTRLAAYLAIAESPSDSKAAALVYKSLKDNLNTGDRWLSDGLASAAAKNADGFLAALLNENVALPDGGAGIISIVARHYASSAPAALFETLLNAGRANQKTSAALIAGMVEGWSDGQTPEIDAAIARGLAATMKTLNATGQDGLLVLAHKWDRLDLFQDQLNTAISRLTTVLNDAAADDSSRSDAARRLIELADHSGTIKAVLAQINLQASPELASGLMRALRSSRMDETAGIVLEKWADLTPGQKNAAIGVLLARGAWISRVFDAIDEGSFLAGDISSRSWPGLRNNPDESIASRAKEISERSGKGTADSEAILERFLPAAALAGDAGRGKELFTAACIVCHMFYGEGAKVGPDLSGIGVRPREDVLTAILDPNRSVESNYRLWTVATKSGEAISGRLDAETETSIDIYDIAGQRHSILRDEIASLTGSETSIMPAGFEALGEQGLADLIEYMASAAKH
ncbi:MAG: putative membrane-bound dehydrogenase-like protein [Candidatus Pelagisphaera sp.]|jgi:putative membrane-bound dehydrogenase-like protein